MRKNVHKGVKLNIPMNTLRVVQICMTQFINYVLNGHLRLNGVTLGHPMVSDLKFRLPGVHSYCLWANRTACYRQKLVNVPKTKYLWEKKRRTAWKYTNSVRYRTLHGIPPDILTRFLRLLTTQNSVISNIFVLKILLFQSWKTSK
jgi:hypothetical protein